MRTSWSRLAPVTGLFFVALLVAAAALSGSEPGSTATPGHVIAFYHVHRSGIEVSAYLNGLAVFVGLIFFATLRDRLSCTPQANRFAATGFAGAVVFAVGGTLAAGTALALAAEPTSLTPAAAQALNILGNDLATFALASGAAVLMLGTGFAIRIGRQLPPWLGWAALVFVVVSLLPIPNLAVLPVGLWTLVASIVLTHRSATTAHPEQVLTPAVTPTGPR